MSTNNNPVHPRGIDAAMTYTRPWEGFHETVGSAGEGVPTLGHGFTLIIDTRGAWEVRTGLKDTLASVGVTLSPADEEKLIKIRDALGRDDRGEADRLIAEHDFPTITRAGAATLFRATITEQARKTRKWIGPDAFDSLSPERQAVLIDFTYQREGHLKKIGSAVGALIATGKLDQAANALEGIGGGTSVRVTDNAAYFRNPDDPGIVRARPGDGLDRIARRYNLDPEQVERQNTHIDFHGKGVLIGQRVRIGRADGGELDKEQNMNKTEATPPDTDGSLLRELEVDVAELAPEARDILGGRLGFDTRDEARVAERRGRVEAAAEEAFFRTPGFDALPRPLGRQLFAAGLQSTPGRAADLLSIALAEAGTRPRKRRKTPGGPSVRPTLTPEIAQAVRRAEGAGRLGEVREGFALGAFRDMAVRAASDERVSRGLDGGLRRNLGLAFGESGGRPEVRAPQALHNGLVWVKGGRAAPLALDGVAGPKTRAGFTRILESIGPDRMARDMAERLSRT